jgi:hypothetical protein
MQDWAWSLSLIVLTTAIHTTGVVMMALAAFGLRRRLETRSLGLRNAILIVIGVIGAVGLLLAVLHGVECTIWAAAYLWLGALDSPTHAMLYSAASRHASAAQRSTRLRMRCSTPSMR